MPAKNIVGDAYVEIHPLLSKFNTSFRKVFKDLKDDSKDTGKEAGEAFGDEYKRRIEISFDSILKGMQKRGREHGEAYGDGFTAGLSNRLEVAVGRSLKGLDPVFSDYGKQGGKIFTESFDAEIDKGLGRSFNKNFKKARNYGSDRKTGSAMGKNLSRAFSRVLDTDFAQSAQAVSKAFTNVLASVNLIGTAVVGLINGIIGLAGALYSMASAASVAAGSVAVLPGLLSLAAQAGGALMVAFKGVGGALSEGFKNATGGAKNSVASIKAAGDRILAAQRRVEDARERLNEAARRGDERIADARERLADVTVQANERIAAANQDVVDAENDLADASDEVILAQARVTQSQEDLNLARLEAIEQLQQLNFSVEGSVLAEERAAISLEKAYEKLQAVQNLPPDSRARREAELSYKETELSYRQAKDRAGDLAAEQRKANKEGVEGTSTYKDALNDISDAEEELYDARKKYAEQQRELEDAKLDARREERDSMDDIADAERDLARVRADAARDIAKAQKALRRALEDLARAYDSAGTSGASAADAAEKYNEALEKLAPAARTFVRNLIAMKDQFSVFKRAVQEPFFEQINKEFVNFIDTILPELEAGLSLTSEVLGHMGRQFLEAFAKPENMKLFAKIMDENTKMLIRFIEEGDNGQSAMANFADVLLRVLRAVQPITDRFVDWLISLSEVAEKATRGAAGMGRMTGALEKAGDRAGLLGKVFHDLWDLFISLGKASDKVGVSLIVSMGAKFEELSGKIDANREKVERWFAKSSRVLRETTDLLGILFGAFGSTENLDKAGDALRILTDPNSGIQTGINNIVGAFASSGPALAELTVEMVDLIDAFTQAEAIEIFISTLTEIVRVVNKILDIPIVGQIVNTIAALAAVTRAFMFAWAAGLLFWKLIAGSMLNSLDKLSNAVDLAKKAFASLGRTLTLVRLMMRSYIIQLRAAQGATAKLAVLTGLFTKGIKKAGAAMQAFMAKNALLLVAALALAAVVAVFMKVKGAVNSAKDRVETMVPSVDALSKQFSGLSEINIDNIKLDVAVGETYEGVETKTMSLADSVHFLNDSLYDSVMSIGETSLSFAEFNARGHQVKVAINNTTEALEDLAQVDPRLALQGLKDLKETILTKVSAEKFADEYADLDAAIEETGQAADTAAGYIAELNREDRAAASAADLLRDATLGLNNAMSAQKGFLNYKNGLDDIKKSLAETADQGLFGDKGRDNQLEYIGLMENMKRQAEEFANAGDPERANRFYAREMKNIIALGGGLDKNKKKVQKFIDTYLETPEQFTTTISAATGKAVGKINKVTGKLKGLTGKEQVVQLRLEDDMYEGVLEADQADLEAWAKLGAAVVLDADGKQIDRKLYDSKKHLIKFGDKTYAPYLNLRETKFTEAVVLSQKKINKLYEDNKGRAIVLDANGQPVKDAVGRAKTDLIEIDGKVYTPKLNVNDSNVKTKVDKSKKKLNKFAEFDWFVPPILDVLTGSIGKKTKGAKKDIETVTKEKHKAKLDATIVDLNKRVKQARKILKALTKDKFKVRITAMNMTATGIDKVKQTFTDLRKWLAIQFDSILRKWNRLWTEAEDTWNTDVKSWLNKIQKALVHPFTAAIRAIKDEWAKLPEAIKDPIEKALKQIDRIVIGPLNVAIRAFGGNPVKTMQSTVGFAEGGFVNGPGSGKSDSILARLSNGEHVTNAAEARKHRTLLEAINSGKLSGMGGAWWNDSRSGLVPGVGSGAEDLKGKNLGRALELLVRPKIKTLDTLNGIGFIGKIFTKGLNNLADAVKSWGRTKEAEEAKKYEGIWTSPGPGQSWGSAYGPRIHPTRGGRSFHYGADVGGIFTALAASSGKVIVRGAATPRGTPLWYKGNHVTIDHGRGVTTEYFHLSKFLTALHQIVKTGQRIGITGATGNVTGPHLHFEVRVNGVSQDPRQFLQGKGVALARGGYVSPTNGGTLAVIGEAGRTERVEPLNSRGLSDRDRDIVNRLDSIIASGSFGGTPDIRVYIGDTELKDIITDEITTSNNALARRVSRGTI